MTTPVYRIVTHTCPYCQYESPTRSCNWSADQLGAENTFENIEDAEAAIPQMIATFGGSESDYRVRQDGERWPI